MSAIYSLLYIAGSSRMKGGSMTAVLLNTIMITALSRAYDLPLESMLSESPLDSRVMLPLLSGDSVKAQRNDRANNVIDSSSKPHALAVDGETVQHSRLSCLSDVVNLLDTFSLVYNAVYRYSIQFSSP